MGVGIEEMPMKDLPPLIFRTDELCVGFPHGRDLVVALGVLESEHRYLT